MAIWIRTNLCPSSSIPWTRVGSDCVEVLWSSLGSQVLNKRTFTIGDAADSIANMNHINRVRARKASLRVLAPINTSSRPGTAMRALKEGIRTCTRR